MKLSNQNTKQSGIQAASGLKAGWSCTSCNFVNGVAYGWNCDDGMKHDCYTDGGHQAACLYGTRAAGTGWSPDGGRCIDKY